MAAQAGAALPRPTAVFRLKATARALAAPCREFSHYAIFCRPPWPHGRDEAKIRGLAAQIAMAGPGANIPSKNANGGKKQPVDRPGSAPPFAAPGDSLILSMVLFRLPLSRQAGLASRGLLGQAPGPAFWRIPVWLPLEAPGLCFAPRFAAALHFFFFFFRFSSFSVFSSARPRMAWGWFLLRRRRRLFAAGLFPGRATRERKRGGRQVLYNGAATGFCSLRARRLP